MFHSFFFLILSHLVYCQILHFFSLHNTSPFCDFFPIPSTMVLVLDLNPSPWTRNWVLSGLWLTSHPAYPFDYHQVSLITPISSSLQCFSSDIPAGKTQTLERSLSSSCAPPVDFSTLSSPKLLSFCTLDGGQ